jgi:hypothetical protein
MRPAILGSPILVRNDEGVERKLEVLLQELRDSLERSVQLVTEMAKMLREEQRQR